MKLILNLNPKEIESKEQFLTFIDVILSHDFVEDYEVLTDIYSFESKMKNKLTNILAGILLFAGCQTANIDDEVPLSNLFNSIANYSFRGNGNCMRNAINYCTALNEAGFDARVGMGRSKRGVNHAWVEYRKNLQTQLGVKVENLQENTG